jgi:hypothetical protein
MVFPLLGERARVREKEAFASHGYLQEQNVTKT